MEEMREDENGDQGSQEQALNPAEQELIPFHGENIVAVRLTDGRIAVVLRWICESLQLRPNGQINRIRRTAAIAQELVRVKVQTPRGGRQVMPALTLRGFPTWILGINPNEVEDKAGRREETERIRQMITAYQVEAVDVLYNHFAQKSHRSLPTPPAPAILPAEPSKPGPEATRVERIAYYENLEIWAHWKASQEAQEWRDEVEEWRGSIEVRLEGNHEMLQLIPEVLERLGPQTVTTEQQTNIRGMVKRLNELTSIPYQTIYWELAQAFQAPRYNEIVESQYPAVCDWFQRRIEAAKAPMPKKSRGQA